MHRFLAGLFLLCLLFLGGNAQDDEAAPEQVTLQLKWFSSYQFAGYYMAMEKGFYKEAGLDVTIRERDPKRNNIEQVISGEAEYGVADSALLLYRAQGKPVKILASIFQHSPLVFIAKKESGILSPYEMAGKSLSYQRGLDDAPLLTMLKSVNINEGDYRYEPLDFTGEAFIRGDVDVMSAYLSDQPFMMREHNISINIINPLNYGIDFYGDNLFTTDREIADHPERVQAFVAASMRGWRYAITHKEETIALLKSKYGAERSPEHLRYEADAIDHLLLADLVDIGYTSIDRFYRIAELYQRLGKADKSQLNNALKELIYRPETPSNKSVGFYGYLILGLLALLGIGFLIMFLTSRRLQHIIADRTALLQTTLDNIRYAVITATRDGIITSFNHEAESMLGYRAEELIGKSTPALFHLPSEVAQRAEAFSNELGIAIKPGFDVFIAKTDHGLPNEHEWTYVAKSGKHLTVLLSVTALKDRHGNTTGYVGIAKDIGSEKKRQRELAASKAMLDEAQRIAGIGSWNLDLKNNVLRWSDEIYRIFEIDPARFEPSYEGFLGAIHPDDVDRVNDAFSASIAEKKPYEVSHRLKMADGRIKYVVERGYTRYDENGEAVFSQGTVQDITEISRVEREKDRYLELIDKYIIVSTTDLKGRMTYVSEAFCEISGYSREELLGKPHNIVRHPDMERSFFEEMWHTLDAGDTWEGEIKNRKKEGAAYWVYTTISPIINDEGKRIGYTAIRQDISDKKRVEELSVTDHLTQVYNRVQLDKILHREFHKSERYGYPFSVILLDVDKFKSVNDTYGHQVGDSVLKETAALLKENLRQTDVLGRWGGEEFLIVAPGTDLEGARALAEKLRAGMEAFSFTTIGSKTASFGVATYHDGDSEERMIERADRALYRAKENGRNRVECEPEA